MKRKRNPEVGTEVARFLQLYYYNKMKPSASRTKALFNAPLWYTRFIREVDKCTREDAQTFYRLCLNYMEHYRDETWKPIQVEKGFSRVLYEDNENLFIYEGRPDFYGTNLQLDYEFVSDHKVQFRAYDIYPYANQPFGYLWALGVREFVYNYLKILSKSFEFRRVPITFEQKLIDNWRSETIEWYFKVKDAIQKKRFLKSFQCSDVYGTCEYHSICECTTDNQKLFTIQTGFSLKPPYRSWR